MANDRDDRRESAPRRGASSAPAESAQTAARKGFVRLGGLWLRESRRGKFMAGRLGLASVFVFKQEKRKKDDPDYALFVAPDQPPSERAKRDREPGEDDWP